MAGNRQGKGADPRRRARDLLHRGQFDSAKALFEDLVQKNPQDAEAHYSLGAIAGQQRRFEDAIRHLRQAVQLQPDALVALCGLGAAYKALGRFGEAEGTFREALRLQPAYPEVLLALADMLVHQKRFAEAERYFREVLRLQPKTAAAYHGLGEIHNVRREIEEEVRCYRQALAIDAKRPLTRYRLGVALQVMGAMDEAVEEYEKAVRLQPDFAPAFQAAGTALSKLGRRSEARAAFHKAHELSPDYLDPILSEADLLEQEGETERAYAMLAPLLERGVRHPTLGVVLANVSRRLNCSQEAIDYLEGLLVDINSPVGGREQVHFALGKLYDSSGLYDEAFAHYRQANDLRPKRFVPDEHATAYTSLMQIFDRKFVMQAPRASISTDKPIFIVGMPRSGTTLTEQILASHPDAFGAGELRDIGNFVTELVNRKGGKVGYPDCFRTLSREVLTDFARRYVAHLHKLAPDARRVVDKMPQNFQALGFISLLFPEARMIHCVRDPRDTCLSIYFQLFTESIRFSNDLMHIGLYYRQYERLMKHWGQVLDLPMLEVRYEDLIANQEAGSREIVAFAGLEWDDRCLAFHRTKRTVVTCSYDQVRQPIYTSSAGRWQRYERHLAPLLEALGEIAP